MQLAKELISIIDKRIDAYMKNSSCVRRYSGQIVSQEGHNRYKVQLLGYDTIYSLPSRSYINAAPGDYVLIESKISNLSNGIIVDILSTPEMKKSEEPNNNTFSNSPLKTSRQELLDFFYPVGTIYETINVDFNPSTTWGGTWELIEAGVALRQAGTGTNGSKSIGTQYGEAAHTLAIAEMPSHQHAPSPKGLGWVPNDLSMSRYQVPAGGTSGKFTIVGDKGLDAWVWGKTGAAGESKSHNNIGPSLAVNIWKRIK